MCFDSTNWIKYSLFKFESNLSALQAQALKVDEAIRDYVSNVINI